MTNLLEQGAAWLNRQRHEHLTRTFTYRRPAQPADLTVALQATVGQTMFRLDEAVAAGPVHVVSRDYLIQTADLVLDGDITLPIRGDQIEETIGDRTLVHEVMAPGGEPEWRYSDPQHNTLRIHTKQIRVDEAP